MKISYKGGWVFYHADKANQIDSNKVGKWMYFFGNSQFVAEICKKALINNIVDNCKHTDNAETGVACFYLNIDDKEGHKRVIKFFLDNNLVKITKKGQYTNMSFKSDDQTRMGEFGDKFNAKLSFSDFIDLKTGEFI